jgi:hypothetical protein
MLDPEPRTSSAWPTSLSTTDPVSGFNGPVTASHSHHTYTLDTGPTATNPRYPWCYIHYVSLSRTFSLLTRRTRFGLAGRVIARMRGVLPTSPRSFTEDVTIPNWQQVKGGEDP